MHLVPDINESRYEKFIDEISEKGIFYVGLL